MAETFQRQKCFLLRKPLLNHTINSCSALLILSVIQFTIFSMYTEFPVLDTNIQPSLHTAGLFLCCPFLTRQTLICCHFSSFKTHFRLPEVVKGDLARMCVCGSLTTVGWECQLLAVRAYRGTSFPGISGCTFSLSHSHTQHCLREKSETIKEDLLQCQTCSSRIPFFSPERFTHTHTCTLIVIMHAHTLGLQTAS